MRSFRRVATAGAAAAWVALCLIGARAPAADVPIPQENPIFAALVESGLLPPVAERIPAEPLVVDPASAGLKPGQTGGTLSMLVAAPGDPSLLMSLGYARLVAYDNNFNVVPDILKSVEVTKQRIFTMHLRAGHKWSDGAPFTSEDFRFWWEDVAIDPVLSPDGPPATLLAEGKRPKVEILDPLTVRFTWDTPNPDFLPALAASSPLVIFRPAHYLKRFHARYANPDELAQEMRKANVANWAALFALKDHAVDLSNPAMPSLQPWVLSDVPTAGGIVALRNPYYHRIDIAGTQLPYIDSVIFSIVPGEEIPARAAAGQSNLQATGLTLADLPALQKAVDAGLLQLRLWPIGRGSELAIYPNLTVADPLWRGLLRDARFRRALSLAIDRAQINREIYQDQGVPGGNSMLPDSPLYDPDDRLAWAEFDPARASELLDELGLNARDTFGVRRLPDGRRLSIVVTIGGTAPSEIAALALVQKTWRDIGVELLISPAPRERFEDRLATGRAVMSVGFGLSDGLAVPKASPAELAPVRPDQNQWPAWGLSYASDGRLGEPPALPDAWELTALYEDWRSATSDGERSDIWRQMLQINADQVFAIGLVGGVPQPVSASPALRNLADKAYSNWEPGAYFGLNRPDMFWLE